jgi:hypothetical protein
VPDNNSETRAIESADPRRRSRQLLARLLMLAFVGGGLIWFLAVRSNEPVPWEQYPAGLQERIDGFAGSRACDALAAELDPVDGRNVSVFLLAAHDHGPLIRYVRTASSQAGCAAP